jgi:tetratricopeptide (TPR) repeat protein
MDEKDNILDEILNHGPSADSIFIALTRMKKEGRLKEVVQQCIKFLRVYPDNIRLRIILAESYLEIGFIGLAGVELEKVGSMIEDLIPAYKLLAEIYFKQQRLTEAADTLKLYLAHCPGEPEALKLLKEIEPADHAQLEVGGPTEDAVVAVDEKDAVSDLATSTIAELYYAQGKLSEAINTYENVINSNPHDSESVNRLIELKGMASEEPGTERKEKDDLHVRTEKLIRILEEWLPKIKEIKYA